jgi:hypothetical protein
MVRKKTDEQKKAEEEKVYFGSITLLVPDELGIMKEMNGDIKLVNTLTKSKNPKRIKGQPSIILKEDKNITEAKLIESGVTVRQQRGLNKMKDTLERGKRERVNKKVSKYAEEIKNLKDVMNRRINSTIKDLEQIDKKYSIQELKEDMAPPRILKQRLEDSLKSNKEIFDYFVRKLSFNDYELLQTDIKNEEERLKGEREKMREIILNRISTRKKH